MKLQKKQVLSEVKKFVNYYIEKNGVLPSWVYLQSFIYSLLNDLDCEADAFKKSESMLVVGSINDITPTREVVLGSLQAIWPGYVFFVSREIDLARNFGELGTITHQGIFVSSLECGEGGEIISTPIMPENSEDEDFYFNLKAQHNNWALPLTMKVDLKEKIIAKHSITMSLARYEQIAAWLSKWGV